MKFSVLRSDATWFDLCDGVGEQGHDVDIWPVELRVVAGFGVGFAAGCLAVAEGAAGVDVVGREGGGFAGVVDYAGDFAPDEGAGCFVGGGVGGYVGEGAEHLLGRGEVSGRGFLFDCKGKGSRWGFDMGQCRIV